MTASEAARNSPAALPATIEELKARLARELGLVCEFDGIVWRACESWLCEEPSGDGLAFLSLTSRRGAPDEVGRINAWVPRSDCHRARSFLGGVAALVVTGADSRLAEEWVAKTVPCLNENRAVAEAVADGIRLVCPFLGETGFSWMRKTWSRGRFV